MVERRPNFDVSEAIHLPRSAALTELVRQTDRATDTDESLCLDGMTCLVAGQSHEFTTKGPDSTDEKTEIHANQERRSHRRPPCVRPRARIVPSVRSCYTSVCFGGHPAGLRAFMERVSLWLEEIDPSSGLEGFWISPRHVTPVKREADCPVSQAT